jgi:glycine cleavage system H protein
MVSMANEFTSFHFLQIFLFRAILLLLLLGHSCYMVCVPDILSTVLLRNVSFFYLTKFGACAKNRLILITAVPEVFMNPDDIKYHREHAWVRAEGKRATIGITDFAQQQMGDIVYIDLPEVDTEIDADSELSEVESTKATSPVVSPVTGTVVEVNEDLADSPEIINEDPYGNGWLVVLEMSDASELNDLMSKSEYEKFLKEEEGK